MNVTATPNNYLEYGILICKFDDCGLSVTQRYLRRYLRIIFVFNGDFEGDGDLAGDMQFKYLLFSGKENAKLFGVGGDPGDYI